MRVACSLGLAALMGAAGPAACQDAPGKWPHAASWADCAPWDGAATTVMLAMVPIGEEGQRPSLRLSVYRHIGGVAGLRWGFRPEAKNDEATAAYCPEEGRCQVAVGGWVTFEPVTGTLTRLDGRFVAIMPGGVRYQGRFSAPISKLQTMCG